MLNLVAGLAAVARGGGITAVQSVGSVINSTFTHEPIDARLGLSFFARGGVMLFPQSPVGITAVLEAGMGPFAGDITPASLVFTVGLAI